MRTTGNVARALALSCLVLGAAMTTLPLASAAHCSANVGGANGVSVVCYSEGPGACGSAAYAAANGSSGAGCFAADYPGSGGEQEEP